MIKFNRSLANSAFEGKEMDIGCGSIWVIAARSSELSREFSIECLKRTGYSSISDFICEAKEKGLSKQDYLPQELAISKQHDDAYNRCFVNTCIVKSECVDTNGETVTIEEIRDELLKKENRPQLEEIMSVSLMDMAYLAVAEEEARDDLKK